MRAFKGFNKDLTCRGYQYEEGKEFHTERAECCDTGFHACEYPLDCFGYYDPAHSVFHEVELSGELERWIRAEIILRYVLLILRSELDYLLQDL